MRLLQEVAAARLSWLPCHTGIRDMLDTERNDLTLPPAGPFGPPEATESKEASRLSDMLGGCGGSDDSFRSWRFCTGPRCDGFGGTLGGVCEGGSGKKKPSSLPSYRH